MNKQRLLDTFIELAQISSPSRSEASVAAYCKKALEQAGCTVMVDDSGAATGSDTGNIIATLPGTVAEAAPGVLPGKLYFSAHMDTVNPCEGIRPIIQEGVIRSAGDTILGGDDKAGVAAIIETVRTLVEEGGPHPPIGVLLSTCEELGLLGAHAMDPTNYQGDLCLVLDGGGMPGTVVIGAPYHFVFEATFTGKAAHAGVEPEKGLSAISLAAKAVLAMELGKLGPNKTANVGTINGGNATNVVPDTCQITGEFRTMDRDEVDLMRANMDGAMHQALAGTKGQGQVEIKWTQEYPGFILPEEDPHIQMVLAQAKAMGLDAKAMLSGGGSDANVFAAAGLKALVLGTGMTDIHGLSESLAIADLESLTQLCLAIVHAMS